MKNYSDLELMAFAKEFLDIASTAFPKEELSWNEQLRKMADAEEAIAERLAEIFNDPLEGITVFKEYGFSKSDTVKG